MGYSRIRCASVNRVALQLAAPHHARAEDGHRPRVLASGKFALKLFVDHDYAGIERDWPPGSRVI
jgi:hypothetical protein